MFEKYGMILAKMIKNRFVLIDAFALIFRAYYALPPLTNKKGVQLNAAYGFTSALLAAIKALEPEYLACGFDLPKPTKRHIEYVEYKAHRAPMPEDLMAQVPYTKEILKAMNIPVFAVEGYEGEDVIASIIAKIRNPKSEILNKSQIQNSKSLNAKRYTLNPTLEFIIVTGDLDCLQLVDEQTKVYSMARGVNSAMMYDVEKVRERYGLEPKQFVDFKALKGDPSDNIPGVPGIGEKGAAKLISEFGNLEKIYKNIAKISGKVQILLKENKEQAFLSQKLSKIIDDVPLEFNLADSRIHDYDQNNVIKLLNKLGFKSLISRLPESRRANNQQKLL